MKKLSEILKTLSKKEIKVFWEEMRKLKAKGVDGELAMYRALEKMGKKDLEKDEKVYDLEIQSEEY